MEKLPDKYAKVFTDWIRGIPQEESSLEKESRGFWNLGRAVAIEAIFSHRFLDVASCVCEGQPARIHSPPTVGWVSPHSIEGLKGEKLDEMLTLKNSVRRTQNASKVGWYIVSEDIG